MEKQQADEIIPAEIAGQLKNVCEALAALAEKADEIIERAIETQWKIGPQQPITAGPDGFDRQKYFNLLYETPLEAHKYAMQFMIGAPVEDFMRDYQTVRTGSLAGMQNMVNAQFAQKHPELLQVPQEDDIHNAEVISKILTENGWTYNLNNLEAAYAVAKTQGKLKLEAAPTMVSDLSGSPASPAEEQEFLRTAPLDKVEQYLELKYPSGKLCWRPLLRRQQNENPEREEIHLGAGH